MPLTLDSNLQVRTVRPADWHVFLEWCTAEGWIISDPERYLFQNQWRLYFKMLWGKNSPRAFISVVRYPASAWIGNLIVDPSRRGCGYGSLLFKAELESLDAADPERTWLTASAMGMPLYLKHGFIWIDDCERWIGSGTGQRGRTGICAQNMQNLIDEDGRAWGESRQELLEYLGNISTPVTSAEFTALLQPGSHSWHIGPWTRRDNYTNISTADIEHFITLIRKNTPGAQTLSIDLLKASKLGPYLKQAGFRKIGSSALMCRTSKQINLGNVCSLASLGSIG